ncbi:MAG: sulfatase-like hydrolase/transferase, partial [Anaerolineae bacterium]
AQAQGYRMGLYTSADMYRPVTLDRTAFASVPDLRVTPDDPQSPSWQRDRLLYDDWTNWQDSLEPGQPFFGFLFFDSANGFGPPPDYPVSFQAPPGHPLPERFVRYQQALHHIDSIIGRVLDDLRRRGLADNTVVLVTSDHGEEFMDSGPEFSLHGSGYSRWQLQVPLLLSWPGRPPGEQTHRSSHYDVAPTLLGRLLGCSNPPATYAAGDDLFDGQDWPWLLAGSYFNYAVLEPDQITVTLPSGLYEVRDWDYRIKPKPEFRGEVLEQVMELNRRFYR